LRAISSPSIHAAVFNTFNVQRHLTSRDPLRVLRDEAFRTWEPLRLPKLGPQIAHGEFEFV